MAVSRSITHKSLWNPSSVGNRGNPGHRYSAHALTPCVCRGNHFSAPFRFYLFIIFPLGWKGFSFLLGRATDLTECIRNCSVGILLEFYWGGSAQRKCDKNFRVFQVTSLSRSYLADSISCFQRCRQCKFERGGLAEPENEAAFTSATQWRKIPCLPGCQGTIFSFVCKCE